MMTMNHYYIDYKYINLISPRLSQFRWKNKDLAVCRCPICGDSQKNKNKKRFYLFQYKGAYVAKCHNCAYSSSFSTLLKSLDSLLYREYRKETFLTNAGSNNSKFNKSIPNKVIVLPPKTTRVIPDCLLKYCERIDSLPSTHPAVQYVSGRKIPENTWKKLYYTSKFNELAKSLNDKQDLKPEHRIVFPFYDQNRELFAVQGRLFMSPCLGIRYLTIKKSSTTLPKIYGSDTTNFSLRNYAVEGPIDSLFVKNGWAIAGSDVDLKTLPFSLSQTVFVYDNEPRNKEIVNRMQHIIDSEYPLVIWPNNLTFKDVNDMVLAGIDVQKMIETCTYSGLTTRIRFNNWKKV